MSTIKTPPVKRRRKSPTLLSRLTRRVDQLDFPKSLSVKHKGYVYTPVLVCVGITKTKASS